MEREIEEEIENLEVEVELKRFGDVTFKCDFTAIGEADGKDVCSYKVDDREDYDFIVDSISYDTVKDFHYEVVEDIYDEDDNIILKKGDTNSLTNDEESILIGSCINKLYAQIN